MVGVCSRWMLAVCVVALGVAGCSSDKGARHADRHGGRHDEGHGHRAAAAGDHSAADDHSYGAAAHQGQMPHRFDDPERWAQRFEASDRDSWQHPQDIIGWLVDRDDLVIADIGAATGYFPVRFAKAVPRGRVVGLDIEASMTDYLEQRVAAEGLTNVEAYTVAADDPGFATREPRPDLVFVCNTYHHIEAREAYFRKVREALAPGARLAIVDFWPDSEKGPPRQHKIAPEVVTAELVAAGWALKTRHDELPDQYVLVFQAP